MSETKVFLKESVRSPRTQAHTTTRKVKRIVRSLRMTVIASMRYELNAVVSIYQNEQLLLFVIYLFIIIRWLIE